jgi:2-dehydro-3-deoxy-D-arabinonate dehydratase
MLVRFYEPEQGIHIGLRQGDTVYDLTELVGSISSWLQASVGQVDSAIAELITAAQDSRYSYRAVGFENAPAPNRPHWLPPVDHQDIWASGVTYERSRDARQEEAIDGGDVYARVYGAERPELFFKARGAWTVGHLAEVGIRPDATWNVPEPELTLVMNPALEVVGVTIGNDMSSRDIEGENPLYLPQAKIYTASCALGPGILLGSLTQWLSSSIQITVERDGKTIVEDQTHTNKIHRRMDELITYLGRCMQYPDGVLLMTGTGIVPASDFSLQNGDQITIRIDTIGTLKNIVRGL